LHNIYPSHYQHKNKKALFIQGFNQFNLYKINYIIQNGISSSKSISGSCGFNLGAALGGVG
jgi:hypothetical protein